MKRIFSLLLLLISLSAFAQTDTKTPFASTATPVPFRYAWTNNGIWTDSTLKLTKYAPAGADTNLLGIIAGGYGIPYNLQYLKNLIAAAGGGGGGTVTNVATGWGLNGGPITTTGTILVDTTEVPTFADLNEVSGALAIPATRVPYGTGTSITSEAAFTYTAASNRMVVDTVAIYRAVVSDTNNTVLSQRWLPKNFGLTYAGGYGTAADFRKGWTVFNGVNASNRPNVVGDFWDYNMQNPGTGSRLFTDEAAFRFGTETHYETGGLKLFEFHLPEFIDTAGVSHRIFSWYLDKTGRAPATASLEGAGLGFYTWGDQNTSWCNLSHEGRLDLYAAFAGNANQPKIQFGSLSGAMWGNVSWNAEWSYSDSVNMEIGRTDASLNGGLGGNLRMYDNLIVGNNGMQRNLNVFGQTNGVNAQAQETFSFQNTNSGQSRIGYVQGTGAGLSGIVTEFHNDFTINYRELIQANNIDFRGLKQYITQGAGATNDFVWDLTSSSVDRNYRFQYNGSDVVSFGNTWMKTDPSTSGVSFGNTSPSVWHSSRYPIQFGGTSSIVANESLSPGFGSIEMSVNAHLNASADWKYMVDDKASNYTQYDGNHYFQTAVSGTAGNTITWLNAMSVLADQSTLFEKHATFKEISAPSTPSSGQVAMYAKSDGFLYSKDDAGVETQLGGSGGAGTVTSVSVTSANGFGGSVATATTTPAITITTSVTGITKGNGTALSAATAGTDYTSPTGTETLTNKRIVPRVGGTTSSATPTPNADAHDLYELTALATDPTFGAPTGTPTNGQVLVIRIVADGSNHTLAWNAAYNTSSDFALPVAISANKKIVATFLHDTATGKWDCTGLTNF